MTVPMPRSRSSVSTRSRSPTSPCTELDAEQGFAESAGEVVEHDDLLAALDELQDHVAADVAAPPVTRIGLMRGGRRRIGVIGCRAKRR